MQYEQIIFERRGKVALITLNRPERLNAWTAKMSRELVDVLQRCNEDSDIGAIAFTGAGRAYCAGADLKEYVASREANEITAEPAIQASEWIHLVRASKPIVAAVNGVAVGVGLTHILPFDFRFASDRARFGMVFINVGLVPEFGSSHLLPQLVGLGAALDLCLTGRLISAEEALRINLVHRVLPSEQLLDEALAFAGELAAKPRPQVRMIKEMIAKNSICDDIESIIQLETIYFQRALETPEHREAVRAFIESHMHAS